MWSGHLSSEMSSFLFLKETIMKQTTQQPNEEIVFFMHKPNHKNTNAHSNPIKNHFRT